MINIVALLFVLVGSVVERSDAVSCYNCQYVSLQSIESTCSEPFSAANAPTCNGPVCEFIYQDVAGPQKYSGVSRNCTSQLTFQVDQCLTYSEQYMYKQFNYTFFTYGSSCCYSYNGFTADGAPYQTIACQCQKDNCNGDLPHKIPSNAGFSLKPVSKLFIGVVAVITVLSKITWYI